MINNSDSVAFIQLLEWQFHVILNRWDKRMFDKNNENKQISCKQTQKSEKS